MMDQNYRPFMTSDKSDMKIGVFVIAYNAAKTIKSVLTRLPESAWSKIEEVFIFDDASIDYTVEAAHLYDGVHRDKISTFGNQVNLGYGGNQKRGYRYASHRGHDIVVLLHGDGQYAPESIETLIEPIASGRADAVFGSRMLNKGGARQGGMPLYKYLGNRILSKFQNWLLPGLLSEYHSGYRAYYVPSLKKLPLMENSNDFHFDTEIIIQLMEAGMVIEEVPIPTYYGDEICHVNGIKYAWDVFKATMSYRFHKAGMKYDPRYDLHSGAKYSYKSNHFSSHERIIALISELEKAQPQHILDVGCGSGHLAARLAEGGSKIVGMDVYDSADARQHCDTFIVADIEGGLSVVEESGFSCIIFADVLEHVRNPEDLLLQASSKLAEGGKVIASTGNVAHLFIRLMLLIGRFEYADRGILDRTHVRLFTTKSFKRLFDHCSYKITRIKYCPIPFENIIIGHPRITNFLSWINMGFVKILPSLFAYQIIIEAEPRHDRPSDLLRQQQIMDDYVQKKPSDV